MKTKFILSAACAVIIASTGSQAATIVGVTIEDKSSERGGFSRFATNTIDGDLGTDWQTNNDADKWITFDLGQVYLIDSFTLWNYRGQDNSDVKDVLVTYSETATTGQGNSLNTFTFVPSGSETGDAGQQKTFTTISARYLRFDIQTMQSGDASLSSTRAGFTEITFNAVPEPSAALFGGLGCLLLLRRRR